MKRCDVNKDKRCIRLYKKRPGDQNYDKVSKQSFKKVEQNNIDMIILNLNKWRLLSHGGAFWIFHLQQSKHDHLQLSKHNYLQQSNHNQPNTQNQTFNTKNSQDSQTFIKKEIEDNRKQQFRVKKVNEFQKKGDYVFRLRQLKWLQKSIDIRVEIIVLSLKNQLKILTNQSNSHQKIQMLQSDLEKQELHLSLHQIKEVNPLTDLLRQIYDQFLSSCLNNKQQSLNENSPHKVNKQNKILPQISKAIVRQSLPFQIDITNKQDMDSFIQFLIRQLIFHKLKSKINKQKLSPLIKGKNIQQIISNHLKTHPIKYKTLKQLLLKEEIKITFQPNLLYFKQQIVQYQVEQKFIYKDSQLNNKDSQLNNKDSQQNNEEQKISQIHIGQIFQFKPKTILPDIYSQQFINHFVSKYKQQQSVLQLVKKKDKYKNHVIFKNADEKSRQETKDNQMRPQSVSQQQIKQAIIEQIQSTIDNNNPSKLSISSTRWFKKNCLQQGKKKKNQNPIGYFINCLTTNNLYQRQTIDYYGKKHLRKSQILQIVQKDKMTDKSVQIFDSERKEHTLYNYGSPHPQIRKQSVHDKIVKHISSYQLIQTKNDNQDKKQKLCLIEQILALQLIDVIDCLVQNTNTLDNNQQCTNDNKYIDIIHIQNISYSLSALIKNKQINSISNINKSPLLNNQLLYPSKSLQSIKTAFHSKVYSKSLQLSLLLKNIIFSSVYIDKLIESTFSIQQTQIQNKNTQNIIINQDNFSNYDLKIIIKTNLMYLIRFLISLTWKDISILIRETIISTIDNEIISQLGINNHKQRNQQQNFNQIDTQKQRVNKIISQTTQIQRQIINTSIIDYNLKTLQNINKNLQKDHQFLLNFLIFNLHHKN